VGFKTAPLSVRWIKMQGKNENSRLLRLISPKIISLYQHISTRIVPALYGAREGGLQTCPKGEVNMKEADSSKVIFPYK
jgi:hypothetical protein